MPTRTFDLTSPDCPPTARAEEAAAVFGTSKSHAYQMMKEGHWPSIKVGARQVRVPTSWLRSQVGIEVNR
jgi:excisionase family DNA binding protein